MTARPRRNITSYEDRLPTEQETALNHIPLTPSLLPTEDIDGPVQAVWMVLYLSDSADVPLPSNFCRE